MINTGKLAGKTLYITGASRGIGKAIALKAAKDGAKIVVAAKTADPHPKLPGTIFSAAKEIEEAGGQALPCVVDVRDEGSVQESIENAVKQFGGIDIVVNNASAISLTGTESTNMKKFDLMHQINTRGTYLVSKLALPYLKASKNNPHILNISPPLNMSPRWFRDHAAYTMAKYGMSMCVLGMSEEFKDDRIAVNALWPKTAIITAAMEMLGGGKEVAKQCRLPDIMADAAYVMLNRDCKTFTGNFSIDEEILKEEGCRDFDKYASHPGHPLMPDFFLDEFDSYLKNTPRSSGGSSGMKSASGGFQARTMRAFHTFAPLRSSTTPPATYDSVPQVFDRIKSVSSEKIVSQVQAIYLFDVEEEGKYFIDFKNGTGTVGKGEPKDKPDVTITMNIDNFLKIFNREMSPASAFMTGKIKVKGDLSKALTLEKVMKAAREAAEAAAKK